MALSIPLGAVNGPGKGHLQKKATKTIEEKLPEEYRQILASSLSQFYRGERKHTKEFLSKGEGEMEKRGLTREGQICYDTWADDMSVKPVRV